MKIVLLAPLYLPPADYFRLMADADLVVIDINMPYDKRFKAIHRTRINTAHGPGFLTVPVTKGHRTAGGSALIPEYSQYVSPHGHWWRIQQSTMATLYGPTPFFDLYRQDFFGIINASAVGRPVIDFNIDLILAVCRLCGIVTPLTTTLHGICENDAIEDLRRHDFYEKPETVSVIEDLFKNGRL